MNGILKQKNVEMFDGIIDKAGTKFNFHLNSYYVELVIKLKDKDGNGAGVCGTTMSHPTMMKVVEKIWGIPSSEVFNLEEDSTGRNIDVIFRGNRFYGFYVPIFDEVIAP